VVQTSNLGRQTHLRSHSILIRAWPGLCVPCLVLSYLILPCLRAESPASAPDLKSLVESERAFARLSIEKGMRQAFLKYLAKDSIGFGSGPIKAREAWLARPESKRVLSWEPNFVTIASSGEIGYSTGPWLLKNAMQDAQPAAYGEFVSIWQKQARGNWEVLLDIGIAHEKPASDPGPLQVSALPPQRNSPTGAASPLDAVRKLDDEVSSSLIDSISATMERRWSNDVRVYRPGKEVALGKEAARAILGSDSVAWTAKGDGISRAADLAYFYGSYSSPMSSSERGGYLRVWRKNAEASWELVVDLLSSPEKPAE